MVRPSPPIALNARAARVTNANVSIGERARWHLYGTIRGADTQLAQYIVVCFSIAERKRTYACANRCRALCNYHHAIYHFIESVIIVSLHMSVCGSRAICTYHTHDGNQSVSTPGDQTIERDSRVSWTFHPSGNLRRMFRARSHRPERPPSVF